MYLITIATGRSILSSPEFIAVAFAVYMQAAHVYSGFAADRSFQKRSEGRQLTRLEFANLIFIFFMMVGSMIALASFNALRDCQPQVDQIFGSASRPCFSFGLTIITAIRYAPLSFGPSGAVFFIRGLITNGQGRSGLIKLSVICAFIAGLSMLLYPYMAGQQCCEFEYDFGGPAL